MHGKAALDTITLPKSVYEHIITCITRPICGFEHKTNADGTQFSQEQQLQATRQQVILLVKNHYAKGAGEEELIKIIKYFTS